ncbi:hypothetical protein ACRRTK_015357 [Alexandromys fortis]
MESTCSRCPECRDSVSLDCGEPQAVDFAGRVTRSRSGGLEWRVELNTSSSCSPYGEGPFRARELILVQTGERELCNVGHFHSNWGQSRSARWWASSLARS